MFPKQGLYSERNFFGQLVQSEEKFQDHKCVFNM